MSGTLPVTVLFALDLAQAGVRLTYRLNGFWTVLGDASMDTPCFERRLAEMLGFAQELHPGPVVTDIVLPRSHVRYLSLDWQGDAPVARDGILRELTEPSLPHLDELAFDWVQEAGSIRLALAEWSILCEAEHFARNHGFTPGRLTARPRPMEFPGVPVFPSP